MKIIRDIATVQSLVKDNIRLSIEQELESLLEEFPQAYNPCIHGWFIVLETVLDLYAPLGLLPYSLLDKLQANTYDWLGKTDDYYQVLLIINDNEGLMIYLPLSLTHQVPTLEKQLLALATHAP